MRYRNNKRGSGAFQCDVVSPSSNTHKFCVWTMQSVRQFAQLWGLQICDLCWISPTVISLCKCVFMCWAHLVTFDRLCLRRNKEADSFRSNYSQRKRLILSLLIIALIALRGAATVGQDGDKHPDTHAHTHLHINKQAHIFEWSMSRGLPAIGCG